MSIMEYMNRVLTPRQAKLLYKIVHRYIKTGEPISSKSLEGSRDFPVSSATIRNEMNELERAGYLTQPHVSSGRMPTDRAYRFYVDSLAASHDFELAMPAKKKINNAINDAGEDPRSINKTIAHILANLSDNVVITNVVENNDFYKVGLSSLFDFPEFKEFDRMFEMTSIFDRFEEIFNAVESSFFGEFSYDEPQIFIGSENSDKFIRNESVILARYDLPGNYTGSITLIGPTRMDYSKNISLIKYATEELNKIAKTI